MAALALSSPTKVIVRFVFGSIPFFRTLDFMRSNWELKIGRGFFFFLPVNSLPYPHCVSQPNQPATVLPKRLSDWLERSWNSFFFILIRFPFYVLRYFYSLTLPPTLWLFSIADLTFFFTVWE